MPAYFENGVFTDAQPAWHGMGLVVEDETLTSERIFELVPELASNVLRCPILAPYGDPNDPGIADTDRWLANVREFDGKILGVQGPNYQVFQTSELFEFGDAIVGQLGGSHYKTAGSIKGGSVVWGLIELPGEILIGGADKMVPYLFLTNSFDGTCTLQARTAWTRVVCWNTWNMAMSQGSHFSIRHTSGMGDRVVEAQEALAMTFKLGEEIQKVGDKLFAEKMSKREFARFLAQLAPLDADSSKTERDNQLATRSDVSRIFFDSPTTADAAGTKWGALQAVTEFTQRYQSVKATSETRMRKTLLATPELNTRALALLS